MNLTAPAAAKRIGISVQWFRKIVGQLGIVPVKRIHRKGMAHTVSEPYYASDQVQRILASHRAQYKTARDKMERERET